jgi:hypothetical protein
MEKQTILELRDTELSAELAAKLWPFTQAYRPHDSIPTWQEFKADGIDKIEEESLMDVIIDQYECEEELQPENAAILTTTSG